MSGEIGMGQVLPSVGFNANFSNIWNNLNFGGMGTFESRKGRWGIIVDGVYVALSHTSDPLLRGRLGTATANVNQGILEAVGAYRVLESDTVPVDLLAGIRYTYLYANLSLSSSRLLPNGAFRSQSTDWVDGVAGVRAAWNFANHWSLTGYADAGTGGTRYSWQLLTAVGYELNRTISLKGGYRILSQNYDSSSFYYNVRTEGPFVGAQFRF